MGGGATREGGHYRRESGWREEGKKGSMGRRSGAQSGGRGGSIREVYGVWDYADGVWEAGGGCGRSLVEGRDEVGDQGRLVGRGRRGPDPPGASPLLGP